MWGTEHTLGEYDNNPSSLPALTEANTTNHYFQQLKEAPQLEKDQALSTAIALSYQSGGYLNARANIFAAIQISGAHLSSENKVRRPLALAATYDDIPLAQWLIETVKVNIHGLGGANRTALCWARAPEMHTFLAQHGALDNPSELTDLLNSVAERPQCPPKLISYYRDMNKEWASPLSPNESGYTPLMSLCDNAQNYVYWVERRTYALEKVRLLFANLTKDKTKTMLLHKSNREENVFAVIASREITLSKTEKAFAANLKNILYEKLAWAEEQCQPCEQKLTTDSVVLLNCDHIYCKTCKEQYAECPQCVTENIKG